MLSEGNDISLLTRRCKKLVGVSDGFKKYKKEQILEIEKQLLMLEKGRLTKQKVQENILGQMIRDSRVAKVDKGIVGLRQQTELVRERNYQRSDFQQQVQLYNQMENAFEVHLHSLQSKNVFHFKDLLDYHRLILSEGLVLEPADAEAVVVFLKWIKPAAMNKNEKYFLKVLARFYYDAQIVSPGYFIF